MSLAGHELRLHELLAGRALGDLSPAERADRVRLEDDARTYARIAAELAPPDPAGWEPMPTRLAARLSRLAREFEAGRAG